MLKILSTLTAIGVFMFSPFAQDAFAASDINKKEIEKINMPTDKAQITKLKNGLTVYILPDERFPLVSTRLYVRAGSSYETVEEAGISHVLEHMVFKGTNKRPLGAVAGDIEAAGGYLNAATSFDYTVYLTDLPSKHWALGLDVVNDMAFNPTLDAKELESEKKVVLAELQRSLDNPGSRVFKELQKNALKGTSYEWPIIGFEKTIKAVTPESMRNYIAKYYQPQNMLLVVVGNVKPKEVLAEAQKLFGGLKNTSDMSPINPFNPQEMNNASVDTQRGPWNKVHLGMALPVPGNMDTRSDALEILAHLLGGDATSYLYKKYKYEKQLVDDIFVGNFSFERVGMFYFSIQLDADKVEPFWKEFVNDIANLKTGVFSDKDIARTKLQMEDSIHRTKETLSGLASWKGQLELFHGGDQGEKNILYALNDVNKEQLQDAIDTWLVPQRFNVSILAPNDAQIPDLAVELNKTWPVKNTDKGQSKSAEADKTSIIDLGEGRKLVLIPDATMPYTALDFYMVGGNSLASKDKQGLATLVARTLTTGTKDFDAPQMEEYFAERAASISAVAGRQVFGLSMREPSRFNDDLFKVFADVLNAPTFREEEVNREKADQLADISNRDDKALGLAFSQLPQLLYAEGHPYAYKTLGDKDNVEKYTKADIEAFWKKQIEQPWVLAVAGDFDAEKVINFAKSLPTPKTKAVEISIPKWGKKATLDLHLPERDQAHLILAFPTVPAAHDDATALELLQNTLSGQSGLLFTELRDKQGLGYTVTAQNRLSPKAGYMFFYIGTEPEKVATAKKGFESVIADIQANPLPEETVQGAKNLMEGDYYRERQSLGSRSSEAAILTILGRELDFKQKSIAKAQELTPEDLRKIAQKYLKLDEAYTLTVKP